MDSALQEVFSGVIRLSSAQREQVYDEAQEIAEEQNDSQLLAHLGQAYKHEKHVREVEQVWDAKGPVKAEYVSEMKPLDNKLDKYLTSVHTIVHGHMSGEDDVDPETMAKGEELLGDVYPNGPAPIIRMPYVDESAAANDIVDKLQNKYAEHVQYFGLQRKVKKLAKLAAQYADAVRRSPDGVTAQTVQAAQARGHLYLLEILSRVLGNSFDSNNPSHVATRNRVLDVLFEQISQTRNRRVARRRRHQADQGTEEAAGTQAPPQGDDTVEANAPAETAETAGTPAGDAAAPPQPQLDAAGDQAHDGQGTAETTESSS